MSASVGIFDSSWRAQSHAPAQPSEFQWLRRDGIAYASFSALHGMQRAAAIV
jgi:hypothetical protein